jgi:hypothetical protein
LRGSNSRSFFDADSTISILFVLVLATRRVLQITEFGEIGIPITKE